MAEDNYIRVRLSTEAKRELKMEALNRNTSMSEIVRNRLRNV